MAGEVGAADLIVQAIRDLAAPGSVGVLGWWLSGRFRKAELSAEAAADKVAEKAEVAMDKHEMVDQARHEENLKNFGEIRVALARHHINGS